MQMCCYYCGYGDLTIRIVLIASILQCIFFFHMQSYCICTHGIEVMQRYCSWDIEYVRHWIILRYLMTSELITPVWDCETQCEQL